MASIILSASTQREVALLAAAWGISEGDAVQRLVDTLHFRAQTAQVEPNPSSPPRVPIHATYGSLRTEGLFDPATQSVQITSGPLVGQNFKSPSGAAKAVVSTQNSAVTPNRDGWGFWTVTATGQKLESIRTAK